MPPVSTPARPPTSWRPGSGIPTRTSPGCAATLPPTWTAGRAYRRVAGLPVRGRPRPPHRPPAEQGPGPGTRIRAGTRGAQPAPGPRRPPDHTRLRTLVNSAFVPRRIALLEPFIAQVAHRLLDRIEQAVHIDLIADFAAPLTFRMICAILGVPAHLDTAATRDTLMATIAPDPSGDRRPRRAGPARTAGRPDRREAVGGRARRSGPAGRPGPGR